MADQLRFRFCFGAPAPEVRRASRSKDMQALTFVDVDYLPTQLEVRHVRSMRGWLHARDVGRQEVGEAERREVETWPGDKFSVTSSLV